MTLEKMFSSLQQVISLIVKKADRDCPLLGLELFLTLEEIYEEDSIPYQVVVVLNTFFIDNHPFFSIPLQVVMILGGKLSVLIDPIANGRDSWKKIRCYRSRRDPLKKISGLSIPLQMVVNFGRKSRFYRSRRDL
ncbi:9790_t:CDS:2 [Funneliformis geosporum]|uniref:9790_t:CDS:1 n=1 Tax=Funneliformis geosporum TaxID=1117311 RepID=A0A9W4SLF1_9GLOM|nr:9790_t:CDS:2 [Funneliformis geosporum]